MIFMINNEGVCGILMCSGTDVTVNVGENGFKNNKSLKHEIRRYDYKKYILITMINFLQININCTVHKNNNN